SPARQLSQGQRRRVALARLVVSPATPLWVLDEPFNALDTAATGWLCGLLQAHLERGGVVVLTSHQDVALDALAERVIPLAL
ncbi:MAG: ATP-binding cassette domain-containing protein, partial [Rhodoferax sp.]|nr:ATP-binding cassette domain-containing protein [Rhodoferax sp.]